jgi:predicted metal-dependent phosphoesterase TrpH
MAVLFGDPATKLPGLGVDFHMHTIASDGAWTPEKLVDTAVSQGIRVMTVSDHDTIKSVKPVAELAKAHGIQFIPGVEVTITWKSAMYHLLLFNFDPSNPALNKMLDDTQRQLLSKKDFIIEELKKLGYKLHRLDEFKRPDGDFLAVDIARALHRGGEVRTFDQALNLCLQFGLQERVCAQPADKALRIGVAAGGIPVLAHPNRYEKGFTVPTDQTLHEFKEAGLAGVEAYHPSHKPEDVARLLKFANDNELAVSCGSDSHNEARRPQPWNPELCRSLLERFDVQVPRPLEAAS